MTRKRLSKKSGLRERVRLSTPFSDFIRNASPAEKEKVYGTALQRASAAQNEVIAARLKQTCYQPAEANGIRPYFGRSIT